MTDTSATHVLEVAIFAITPGSEDAFVAAYREATTLIEDSAGVGAVRMTRGVEDPSRFVLLVEWESVAAHEAFRSSEAFPRWRALIGPHFAAAPEVFHVTAV